MGKSKQEMVRVSSEVKVGEAVSSLGQFIEYYVPVSEEVPISTTNLSDEPALDAITVLLQAAKNKTSLPNKWSPVAGVERGKQVLAVSKKLVVSDK